MTGIFLRSDPHIKWTILTSAKYIMRIAILNSGGDCPGLNAVIHGVVGAAEKLNWEVIGFIDGFEGMLPPERYMPLDITNTMGIQKLGGTVLGTTNKGNFGAKVGVGNVMEVPHEIIDRARKTFDDLNLEGLVIVGGDGTLTTALQLYRMGWPVVGVPKTIDNDLEATARTFGFDSAVSTVVDALDRLQTTALSHKRVLVLEVMGRHAGWIALHGGIAGGANVILLPEIPFDMDVVCEAIEDREKNDLRSTLVVVAEGALPEGGAKMFHQTSGNSSEFRLGGIGDKVADEIAERTGKETRAVTLGHLQRGGSPTAFDRILGTWFGVKAVQLIKEKQFGSMVSYRAAHVEAVPIEKAVSRLRCVDPDGEEVAAARAVGICMGK